MCFHIKQTGAFFLNYKNMHKIASFLIQKHGLHDTFYVANMGVLRSKIDLWRRLLPNVEPFYAVKCNPDRRVLQAMVDEGMGFDCASKSEIETVVGMGCRADNIVYAHPVKKVDDLKYAVESGIRYTTFDSISELEKLRRHAPGISCVIRLKVDNPSARVQLGLKYGADRDEYMSLIDAAMDMDIQIAGASFHVGSASKDPEVFAHGIDYCREVFDYAKQRGHLPSLLDIGGGFTRDNFEDCAAVISRSLGDFAGHQGLRVIAEPGRYFAEQVFTLFTPVVGQRSRAGKNEYWLGESLYGSFNCVLYDGQVPTYRVLRNPLLPPWEGGEMEEECVLQMITCDSADSLGPQRLPRLRNEDYVVVENFGAYTLSGACNFNGINLMEPQIFYVDS